MSKPTVTAIQWESVDGKKLLYLKIEGGGERYTVNVGQKTYDAVLAMEKQTELPLSPMEEIVTEGLKKIKTVIDGNKG